MPTVFTSAFLQVDYLAPLPLLYAQWTPKATQMPEGEFVDHLEQFVSLVSVYRAEAFVINCQQGHFLLRPELQQWHDTEIVPQYLELGVKRIGVILAENDFYTTLSMQLTFEEEQASQLPTRFFPDVDSAQAWATNGLPQAA
jgi:hypothetical protein